MDDQCQHLSLVDIDGQFVSTSKDIDTFVKASGDHSEYCVVGIMGCQSSGKSTLLNLVFGTKFDMLDASNGRKMTTKGIWLGSSPKVPQVLLLDLEGTDSSNRGDQRGSFERQTALFGLALTEILIVNMWQSDIGRHVAANYGVLSTVFEMNLKLFANNKGTAKTMLLFMIRDFDPDEHTLSMLEKQLKTDMGRIWAGVPKPEEFKSSDYTDFFESRFYALQHKKYREEQFNAGIEDFRSKFTNVSSPESYFNTPFHMEKSVPALGLGRYCEQLWESITLHKDLNIPSERTMLAIYRCDSIIAEITPKFLVEIAKLKKSLGSDVVEDFGSQSSALLGASLSEFDSEAKGYHVPTVTSKRIELLGRLESEIEILYREQMSRVRAVMQEQFKSMVVEDFGSGLSPRNFQDTIQEFKDDVWKRFDAQDESSRTACPSAECRSVRNGLKADMMEITETFRNKQVDALEELCKETIRSEIQKRHGPIDDIVMDASRDMWEQLNKCRVELCRAEFETIAQDRLKNLASETNSIGVLKGRFMNTLKYESRTVLLSHMRTQAGFVKARMLDRFYKLFLHDSRGRLRRWGDSDDVEAEFTEACESTETLLELFSVAMIDDSLFGGEQESSAGELDLHLLAPEAAVAISGEFSAEVSQYRVQALLQQERDRQGSVPKWVFAALLFLGWNELMMMLRNPLLLILVLVLGMFLFVLYQLNLLESFIRTARFTVQNIIHNITDNPMAISSGSQAKSKQD